MADRQPSAFSGLVQLKEEVEGEVPGFGSESVGAVWPAAHRV